MNQKRHFLEERGDDELLKKIILDVKGRDIKYLACEMGYDQRKPYTHL